MNLKELEIIFNEKLKSLEGKKFKNSTEFHAAKNDAIAEAASKYGFKVKLWSLEYMLGNDVVYESDVKIFNIKTDVTEDKRVKYGWAGKIISISVTINDMFEDLKYIDLKDLNKFYIKKYLEDAIKCQEKRIEEALNKVKEEQATLVTYKKAYLKAKKNIELSLLL